MILSASQAGNQVSNVPLQLGAREQGCRGPVCDRENSPRELTRGCAMPRPPPRRPPAEACGGGARRSKRWRNSSCVTRAGPIGVEQNRNTASASAVKFPRAKVAVGVFRSPCASIWLARAAIGLNNAPRPAALPAGGTSGSLRGRRGDAHDQHENGETERLHQWGAGKSQRPRGAAQIQSADRWRTRGYRSPTPAPAVRRRVSCGLSPCPRFSRDTLATHAPQTRSSLRVSLFFAWRPRLPTAGDGARCGRTASASRKLGRPAPAHLPARRLRPTAGQHDYPQFLAD